MQKKSNTDSKTPPTDLLSKVNMELDSEMKSKTLAAVAKLDAATVCQGCGSGWYNWGGSWGGAGGNWFGDSMCGMGGYCASSGGRRNHRRACNNNRKLVPTYVECQEKDATSFQTGQPAGTMRCWDTGLVKGEAATDIEKCQDQACIRKCVNGETSATTVSGNTCSISGYSTAAAAAVGTAANTAHNPCAENGYGIRAALEQATKCYAHVGTTAWNVGTHGGSAKTGVSCGKCTPLIYINGACNACKCNAGASIGATDDATNTCGPGEYSCTPASCDPSTHVVIKTAKGHDLCIKYQNLWRAP